MNEFVLMLTDYNRDFVTLTRKLRMARAAFPCSTIFFHFNCLDDAITDKTYELCTELDMKIVQPTVPQVLRDLHGTGIETGYVCFLDILRAFAESDLEYCMYMESDFYPVHHDCENIMLDYFRQHKTQHCMASLEYVDVVPFMLYKPLLECWFDWIGHDIPMLSLHGFYAGFTKAGAQVVMDELDSDIGKEFFELFLQYRDMPAAKWIVEMLLSSLILKNHGGIFDCPSPVDSCYNNEQFVEMIAQPNRYFIHNVRNDPPRGYPNGVADLETIHNMWGV